MISPRTNTGYCSLIGEARHSATARRDGKGVGMDSERIQGACTMMVGNANPCIRQDKFRAVVITIISRAANVGTSYLIYVV